MTLKLETKLRWFDLGAAALERVWPELVRATQVPTYICPQCFDEADIGKNKVYTRLAVEAGELTAEHVPSKSLGGKELILTCAHCNHLSGSRIESHASKKENLEGLGGGGQLTRPTRVHIKGGDHRVSATLLQWDEKRIHLELPPLEKHANNPREVAGLLDYMQSEAFQKRRFNISGEGYQAKPALVAWLRAAYLTMFAVNGYHYIFGPGLAIVRRQIREPQAEHIPAFHVTIAGERPLTERRIMRIREPEWQRSWAVQFDHHLVLLPLAEDATLYERLTEKSRRNHIKITSSESWEWPPWPSFGIEPDDVS